MGGATDRTVVVGRFGAAFGVKGWVKVTSFTSPPENLMQYTPWLSEVRGEWREVALESVQRQGKGLIARIEGCVDRDAADRFKGREIAVPRTELPQAEAGEYYWFDLLGSNVETLSGVALGRVVRLIETGANDVLVVRDAADGSRERLIPFIEAVVPTVDVGERRIVVDWDPEF